MKPSPVLLLMLTLLGPVRVEAIDGVHANGFDNCMASQLIQFNGGGGDPVSAWLVRPSCTAPADLGLVVMLHGCSGLHDGDTQTFADLKRLYRERAAHYAARGFASVLVDSFTARAQAELGVPRQDFCSDREAVVLIGAREEIERPVDAAAAAAHVLDNAGALDLNIDPAAVFLLGWSHGGSATLTAAAVGVLDPQPFAAAMAWYPGCGLYGRFNPPGEAESDYVAAIPLLLEQGTADPISEPVECEPHWLSSDGTGGAAFARRQYADALHSYDWARCERDDAGSELSPWTGLAYSCSGSYSGTDFGLDDWRAQRTSRAHEACWFATETAPGDADCALLDVLP